MHSNLSIPQNKPTAGPRIQVIRQGGGSVTEISREIFREYDIRGEVDRDLTEDGARAIGQAYGTAVRNRGLSRVSCARDGRTHSLRIQAALMEGIRKTGCDVVNIGECPTPLLYFSIFHLGLDGGVQVTGSHNPPAFNGFKMCIGPSTIHGADIQALREIIEAGSFATGAGRIESREIIQDYRAYMRRNIHIKRGLTVVLDAGNGVGGLVAPQVFEDQGCRVIPLFCDVDGTFPNHHPDPTIPENLEILRQTVLSQGADVGMAFDGDADRLGVVDEKGNILYGDQLLMIFAREVLRENPGAAVIGEVKCSHVMYEDIAKRGGRPIMWKTGHSLIKQKMRDEGALLAGEMSGHLFFADRYFGYDDGIYAALRLVELLAASDAPLSSHLAHVPKTFSTPEIRRDCPDDIKFAIVEKAREGFRGRYEIIDVDGVRVLFPDGWGLIRASNTQPVLVLRFEAETPARLQEIRDVVEGRLDAIIRETS